MFDTFKTKAEAVSSEVHRFAKKSEAVDFVTAFLQKEGVQDAPGCYAAWADSGILAGVDTKKITEQVPGLTFEVERDRAARTRIGISQADFGLANTGTLVQNSTNVEQRLVSTLPEIHVAILHTGSIIQDLPALFSKLRPPKSSYLAFITGPSRTADIERVLTIGVHGPERLVIVCVDEQ